MHGFAVSTINYLLIAAAILSGFAAWIGIRSVTWDGGRSRWTMPFMLLSFCVQLYALSIRGELRGSCPLSDPGEILMFLGWSLTLFYLMVGSAYRVSLLGVFSAPVVTALLLVASMPGMLDYYPVHKHSSDYWWEMHTALSVLSYGALGLGSVAAVMFVVLNGFLKKQEVSSGLFKTMPPVNTLVSSMVRLTVVGVAFLTVGLFSGVMMQRPAGAHLCVAATVWIGYLILLGVWYVRGMTPKRMALLIVSLFMASLSVFAAL